MPVTGMSPSTSQLTEANGHKQAQSPKTMVSALLATKLRPSRLPPLVKTRQPLEGTVPDTDCLLSLKASNGSSKSRAWMRRVQLVLSLLVMEAALRKSLRLTTRRMDPKSTWYHLGLKTRRRPSLVVRLRLYLLAFRQIDRNDHDCCRRHPLPAVTRLTFASFPTLFSFPKACRFQQFH